MRLLQKTDGDPFLYAWTEALDKRKDMREVTQAEAEAEDAASADDEDGDELDRINTVAGLRDFAAANGVELPEGLKSKPAMRDAIREALLGPDSGDSSDPLGGE